MVGRHVFSSISCAALTYRLAGRVDIFPCGCANCFLGAADATVGRVDGGTIFGDFALDGDCVRCSLSCQFDVVKPAVHWRSSRFCGEECFGLHDAGADADLAVRRHSADGRDTRIDWRDRRGAG